MEHGAVSDKDVAELLQIAATATKAYIGGDMQTYFRFIEHSDDFTLMSPFGGEVERGFDTSPERLKALEGFFQGGDAELDVAETYVSGDLVVLAATERQRGQVGGFPEQDWSLRVTWVFRRVGTGWEQVHRHADPLVPGISLEQLAALARG